jgi:DNA-binding NarL/FixJ family response regulator
MVDPAGVSSGEPGSPRPRIKVVIVDDHRMVADGLAEIIRNEPDLDVIGIAATAAEGIAIVARNSPDVVIMDYSLPDENGAAATATIKARWPDVAVIMLTGSGAEEALARAIEAGCSGFLVKELQGPTIPNAIRAVHRGELVIHAGAMHSALGRLRSESIDKHQLTARELEVLRMMATGLSTEALATKLFVSTNTVRNHVQSVLIKLGAHSKLEAVAIGIREGLVALHYS